MMEAGIKIDIEESQVTTFEYLKNFSKVKYSTGKKAKMLDVTMSHEEPFVKIGKHSQPLLFPNSMFRACKSFWRDNRQIDFLFVGLLTPQRKKLLKNWEKQLKETNRPSNIMIIDSKRGREFPEKSWDEGYYKALADAKFVLCPNGDFVWTYRFFEAMLCGAIPIVQETCSLYKAFTYYNIDTENLDWNEEVIDKNYKRAEDVLGPPPNLKKLLDI
jgi:hypothetical protein